MFNAHRPVVPGQPQLGEKVPPDLFPVAIAHRAEHPGPVLDLPIGFCVQHSGAAGIPGIHAGVLSVDMIDALPQGADGGRRVDPLPEQMAGVKIRAHRRPHRRAQPQHRLRIVDAEAGMQFNGHPDPSLFGAAGRLLPVGQQHLIPLIVQNPGVVVRPGAGHPVGGAVRPAASRAAGEGHHRVHLQQVGQTQRVRIDPLEHLGPVRVRMNRISVTGQGGNAHAAIRQKPLQIPGPFRPLQIVGRVTVGRMGVAACAQLHALHLDGAKIGQHFIQRPVVKATGQYA